MIIIAFIGGTIIGICATIFIVALSSAEKIFWTRNEPDKDEQTLNHKP